MIGGSIKMNMLKKAIEIKPWMIKLRRDFHMYPELGMEEYRTRDKIIENLKEIGIEYRIVANTGVVGIIRGNDHTIAFMQAAGNLHLLRVATS